MPAVAVCILDWAACRRCGEPYKLENLYRCTRCGKLLCPNCVSGFDYFYETYGDGGNKEEPKELWVYSSVSAWQRDEIEMKRRDLEWQREREEWRRKKQCFCGGQMV